MDTVTATPEGIEAATHDLGSGDSLTFLRSCSQRLLAGEFTRIKLSTIGKVVVVRIIDKRIIDEQVILEFGVEVFSLAHSHPELRFLFSFEGVEFLSSAALGKLITADKIIKRIGSQLKLTSIRPEIYEVFTITQLDKFFDIQDNEASALAAF